MSKDLQQSLKSNIIRYANCWEDADILLQGFAAEPNSRFLSIGSAGDNSFALLTTNPELVVAADINPAQLYLIELKKVCIEHLGYQTVLEFFGFKHSQTREHIFTDIYDYLSDAATDYWQHNIEAIGNGIIHCGKFERYFQFFSNRILPFIHNKKTIEQLLAYKDSEAQKQFYHQRWNTWRWRLLFKIFFSKYVMGRYGRDPEFLRQVQVPVSEHIFQKAARQLQSVMAHDNFILRYNLTGSFGNLLPTYLQPQNFEAVKRNISKIEIFEGYIEDALQKYGQFKYFNLSDIFEYMDITAFKTLSEKLVAGCQPGGRFAYWNLMVPRRVAGMVPEQVQADEALSDQLTAADKGFFYNRFLVDRVHKAQ